MKNIYESEKMAVIIIILFLACIHKTSTFALIILYVYFTLHIWVPHNFHSTILNSEQLHSILAP